MENNQMSVLKYFLEANSYKVSFSEYSPDISSGSFFRSTILEISWKEKNGKKKIELEFENETLDNLRISKVIKKLEKEKNFGLRYQGINEDEINKIIEILKPHNQFYEISNIEKEYLKEMEKSNYSLDDFFKELSERISEIGREKIIVTPTEYFYMFRKIFEEIKEEKLGKD